MYDHWADTAHDEGWLEPDKVEKLNALLEQLRREDLERSKRMNEAWNKIEQVLFGK